MIVFLIFTISAASFEGFFVKWTFRDDSGFSYQVILDGTAEKPFIYRQLIPTLSRESVAHIPDNTKSKLIDKLEKHNLLNDRFKQVHLEPEYMLEYYFAYALTFLSLMSAIFIFRRLCIEVTNNAVAGTLAAMAFALVFPLFETFGGYFYDCSEVFFFALAALLAWRGNYIALIILTPFAELNKESFLFFAVTLYPLLRRTQSVKVSALATGVSVLTAGVVYLILRSMYVDNFGGSVRLHYAETIDYLMPLISCIAIYFAQKNIPALNTRIKKIIFTICAVVVCFLIIPKFPKIFELYFRFGHTYSVASGERLFLPHLMMMFWIVKNAWKKLNLNWKYHTYIALAINMPLWILFCSPGELRNLSMMYPVFILMMTFYIAKVLNTYLTKKA